MVRKIHYILLSVLLLASSNAVANEITVVTSNLSPFTISDKEKNPGFLHEVVAEMKKRSGLALNIKYYPWKRAQAVAKSTPNTLIFGITRTKKREPDYAWLVNLLNTEKVFVSNKKVYNSFDEARDAKRISVRKATPYERLLKAQDFKNLFGVQTETQNAALLHHGRAEAWMTLSHRAAYVWKEAGYDVKQLKIGKPLGKSQLFLAGNLSLAKNSELKGRLQKAYDSVVADGTFNELHQKYFGSKAN